MTLRSPISYDSSCGSKAFYRALEFRLACTMQWVYVLTHVTCSFTREYTLTHAYTTAMTTIMCKLMLAYKRIRLPQYSCAYVHIPIAAGFGIPLLRGM